MSHEEQARKEAEERYTFGSGNSVDFQCEQMARRSGFTAARLADLKHREEVRKDMEELRVILDSMDTLNPERMAERITEALTILNKYTR